MTYTRDIRLVSFRIEDMESAFLEEFSMSLSSPNLLSTDTRLTLRYAYNPHKYMLTKLTYDRGNPIDNRDFEDDTTSMHITSWLIDAWLLKDFERKFNLVSKCYVAIENNDLHPSDYQITSVTMREKDIIYREIIKEWFHQMFTNDEDKNSALLELNYNPRVKEVVSQLYEKEIDLNTAKEKISSLNYEPEHLANIFGLLSDNFNVTTIDHQQS